jgi:hypothetical protein
MARPAAFHHQQQQLAAVLLVLAALTVIRLGSASAVTCGQVAGYLTPCIRRPAGYACCSGVRNLNVRGGGPQHRRDRQAACKCLKQITGSAPALKPDIVAGVHPRQVRRRHPLPHQPLHRLRQVIDYSVSFKFSVTGKMRRSFSAYYN